MLFDTHCHLGAQQFDDDRADAVARAREAGVASLVVVADSADSTDQAIALAEELQLSATAGVHPHEASSWSDLVAARIERAVANPAVVAVGEAGLDYHYDHSPRDVQRRVFAEQLALAARVGKPIVVHSRDADADMAAMLRDTDAVFILHSFSSGPDVLRTALDADAYVSFSGMVTFKSWADDEAVRAVGADRLFVETDAPYLAPVPHRGKRNEPAFVREVAARVAAIRNENLDEFIRRTGENAARCFGARLTRLARTTS